MSVRSRTIPVPAIQAWTDEHALHDHADLAFEWSTEGQRLTYLDPMPQDWMMGTLWVRHGQARTGKPCWKTGSVNTPRQRRYMLHGLCQVCEKPAIDSTGRASWLFPTPGLLYTNALGEPFSHIAPTCQACIPISLELCPRLKKGAAVYTAASWKPYAVLADVYAPTSPEGVVVARRDAVVELERFRDLRQVLAKQLMVTFDDLQQVS